MPGDNDLKINLNLSRMTKKSRSIPVTDFEGCQLPCVPKFTTGVAEYPDQSALIVIKRSLSYPWNTYIKNMLKKLYYKSVPFRRDSSRQDVAKTFTPVSSLKKGDLVMVRSIDEIKSTLDPFNELKGCAFLQEMNKYCGTEQRVFKSMERFMDERDYKVKKTRGLILLENNFCSGTPVFGKCDRSCFLFWREEWLEKIES
jgi:hypothetical protein